MISTQVSRIGNWHSDDLYGAFDLYASLDPAREEITTMKQRGSSTHRLDLPYVTSEWCPETGSPKLPPLTLPNVRNRGPPKDAAEACALGMQFGFGKGTTFWAGDPRRTQSSARGTGPRRRRGHDLKCPRGTGRSSIPGRVDAAATT